MVNKEQFILILGMHRSGTSCLTGALERCGVYLGDVRREGIHNKKGYFEIRALQQVHDAIWEKEGASWLRPKIVTEVEENYIQELSSISAGLRNQGICAIKDPRTLFFLEIWKKIAGKKLEIIGSFRHPMAVAKSLYERNKLPIEDGINLWIDYNKVLIEEHRKQPFPLVHYNLENPKQYQKQILSLAEKFSLKPQKLRLRFFVSSRLEHHNYLDTEVPESCKELYSYLLNNR